MSADSSVTSGTIASVSLIGTSTGLVKQLSGFKKGHHTLPDAANDTTNAFLAKICSDELATEAEKFFQKAKASLDYKRKDSTLVVGSPLALLTARDFTLEISFSLDAENPASYVVNRTLRDVHEAELFFNPAFNEVFSRQFQILSFALRSGTRVEAVIDAVEDGAFEGLTVTYPSDCRECTLSIPGVNAEIRCTATALELVFPRPCSPLELIEGFQKVCATFQTSPELRAILIS